MLPKKRIQVERTFDGTKRDQVLELYTFVALIFDIRTSSNLLKRVSEQVCEQVTEYVCEWTICIGGRCKSIKFSQVIKPLHRFQPLHAKNTEEVNASPTDRRNERLIDRLTD